MSDIDKAFGEDDVLSVRGTKQQELERQQVTRDLERVLETPEGRRFVLWVLADCCMYDEEKQCETHAETSFRLGRYWAGRRLIAAMNNINPTTYPKLLLEAAQRQWDNQEQPHVIDDSDE